MGRKMVKKLTWMMMELQLTVGNTASVTVEGENFFQNFLQKQRPSKCGEIAQIFAITQGASLGAPLVKSLTAMQETWVGKISWRRKWQPTPVFLPGEFLGQRSLVGYSPWGQESWTCLVTKQQQRTLKQVVKKKKRLARPAVSHCPYRS